MALACTFFLTTFAEREAKSVAKPEWGKKRNCQSCGTRFYDLQRDPIVCPKCETVFDPLAALRPRRARVATVKTETKQKAPVPARASGDDLDDDVLDDEELEDIGADEDEDDSLIEDASELGEDEDDVGSVAVEDDED